MSRFYVLQANPEPGGTCLRWPVDTAAEIAAAKAALPPGDHKVWTGEGFDALKTNRVLVVDRPEPAAHGTVTIPKPLFLATLTAVLEAETTPNEDDDGSYCQVCHHGAGEGQLIQHEGDCAALGLLRELIPYAREVGISIRIEGGYLRVGAT